MAVDFMATVQAQFARQDRLFVSITRGVQIDRSGAVYLSDQLSNPFLSLIERREPDRLPDTVYVAKHARARAHGPDPRGTGTGDVGAGRARPQPLQHRQRRRAWTPRVVAERLRFDLGYDADIAGRDLLAGRARQAGRLAKLWVSHPGELTKAVEAWSWRLRGTHERPQDDGATLTDRVQQLEQDGRTRWLGSSLRSHLEDRKKDARRTKWRVQRRLNESLPPAPRPVAGDLDAVLGADRVVVLAEYSFGGRLRPEALSGAAAWAAAGVPTLIVAARDAWSPKTLQVDPLPDGVAVVRRPNVGYDFGSWGAALTAYPQIAAKSLVVLTNDSLAGPYGPLDDLSRASRRHPPRCGLRPRTRTRRSTCRATCSPSATACSPGSRCGASSRTSAPRRPSVT